MKIFGDIFPWMGFKTWPLDKFGDPVLGDGGERTELVGDVFSVEWRSHGAFLYVKNIRRRLD